MKLYYHIFNLVIELWSFFTRYRDFLDWRIEKRKDENELYWATADVTNCFTIMDHSFLMKTLSQLIRNDKLNLRIAHICTIIGCLSEYST